MAKHYAHCTITQDNCHKLVTGLRKSDRMFLDVAPSLTAGGRGSYESACPATAR